MFRRIACCAFLGLLLMAAATARGQSLASYVPDDAPVFIAWDGSQMQGKPFEESHLGGLFRDAELAKVFGETYGSLRDLALSKVGDANGADARKAFEMVEQLSPVLWRAQAAFYFRPIPPTFQKVEARLIIKPADDKDKEAIAKGFAMAVKANHENIRLDTGSKSGVLVLVMSDDLSKAEPFSEDPPHPMSRSARLVSNLSGLPGDPTLTIHVSVKDLSEEAMTGTVADRPDNKATMDKARQVIKALGLDNLRSFTAAAGFSGKNWYDYLLIDTPAPRTGLMALADVPALTDADLQIVPDTAMSFDAGKLDIPALLAAARQGIAAVDETSLKQANATVAMLSALVGVDLEKDFLGSLGPTWIVYSTPTAGAAGVMDSGSVMCVVNTLSNPVKFQDSLDKLVQVYNDRAAAAAPQHGGAGGRPGGPGMPGIPMVMQPITTVDQNGVKCYVLSLGMAGATMTVSDGRFVLSTTPQAVGAALAAARHPESSIIRSAKYQQVVKSLGGRKAVMVSYMDIPASAPKLYQALGTAVPMVQGLMALQGLPPIALTLPPFEKIAPHLDLAGSVSWVDDQGIHSMDLMPFPGANYLSPQGQMSLAGVAGVGGLGVGIMLPALSASRTTARQMQASTEARGVQTGQILYAQDHEGHYTDDIAVLVKGNFFVAEYTISPLCDKKVPANFKTWPQDKKDQWIRKNSSFILIPSQKDDADSEKVSVFLNPADSGGKEMSVAFNDNHVNWMPVEEARALIKKQTGKTLEELIARQQHLGEAGGGEPTVAPPVRTTPPPPPR